MFVAFCAAEDVFGGFARKIFLLVVGAVERERVGTGAAGEMVWGEAGGGEGGAGYGEHVGAGGTDCKMWGVSGRRGFGVHRGWRRGRDGGEAGDVQRSMAKCVLHGWRVYGGAEVRKWYEELEPHVFE